FFIVTETSSSASSTNSSTSAPSPRDTKNTPTTTSHSSSSLPSEYGCDLMSLCLNSRGRQLFVVFAGQFLVPSGGRWRGERAGCRAASSRKGALVLLAEATAGKRRVSDRYRRWRCWA